MVNCQNNNFQENLQKESFELSSDNGILDLSEFEEEQRKIDKFLADIALDEALGQRIVSLPEDLDNFFVSDINVAAFARNSNNNLGQKKFTRLKKTNKNNNCKNFSNDYQAQRFFLAKGGPEKDFWFLDNDGDGFACEWKPNFYRNLEIIF